MTVIEDDSTMCGEEIAYCQPGRIYHCKITPGDGRQPL
jgi:hypothetical protein